MSTSSIGFGGSCFFATSRNVGIEAYLIDGKKYVDRRDAINDALRHLGMEAQFGTWKPVTKAEKAAKAKSRSWTVIEETDESQFKGINYGLMRGHLSGHYAAVGKPFATKTSRGTGGGAQSIYKKGDKISETSNMYKGQSKKSAGRKINGYGRGTAPRVVTRHAGVGVGYFGNHAIANHKVEAREAALRAGSSITFRFIQPWMTEIRVESVKEREATRRAVAIRQLGKAARAAINAEAFTLAKVLGLFATHRMTKLVRKARAFRAANFSSAIVAGLVSSGVGFCLNAIVAMSRYKAAPQVKALLSDITPATLAGLVSTKTITKPAFKSCGAAVNENMQDQEVQLTQNKEDKKRILDAWTSTQNFSETAAMTGTTAEQVRAALTEVKGEERKALIHPDDFTDLSEVMQSAAGLTAKEVLEKLEWGCEAEDYFVVDLAAERLDYKLGSLTAGMAASPESAKQQPVGGSMALDYMAQFIELGCVPVCEMSNAAHVEGSENVMVAMTAVIEEGELCNLNSPRGLYSKENKVWRNIFENPKAFETDPKTPCGMFATEEYKKGDTTIAKQGQVSFNALHLRGETASLDFRGSWTTSYVYAQLIHTNMVLEGFAGLSRANSVDLIMDAFVNGQSGRPKSAKDKVNEGIALVRDVLRQLIFDGKASRAENYEDFIDHGNAFTLLLEGGVNAVLDGVSAKKFILIGEMANGVDYERREKQGATQYRCYFTKMTMLYVPDAVEAKLIDPQPEEYTRNATCYWATLPNYDVKPGVSRSGLRGNVTKKGQAVQTAKSAPKSAATTAVAATKEKVAVKTATPTVAKADLRVQEPAVSLPTDGSIEAELKALYDHADRMPQWGSKAVGEFAKYSTVEAKKLQAYKYLYHGLTDAEVLQRIQKDSLAVSAADAVRYGLCKAMGCVGDQVYSPTLLGYAWTIDHLKAAIDVLSAKLEFIALGKGSFKLVEVGENYELVIQGKTLFTFTPDKLVYDARGRAFQHMIMVEGVDDACTVGRIQVADSFSNFMSFFFYGILPLIAGMKGNKLWDNLRPNINKAINKLDKYFKLTTDKVEDQNGGALHAIRHSFAPMVDFTISPFTGKLTSEFVNKKKVTRVINRSWIDLEGRMTAGLSAHYENMSVKHDGNDGKNDEKTLFSNAQTLGQELYGADFHFAKGVFMSGPLGHINLAWVAKFAPTIHKLIMDRFVKATGKPASDLTAKCIIALTLKASKGLKRVLLKDAQAAESVGGVNAGWCMYNQAKPVNGSLVVVAMALTGVDAPGISHFIGDPDKAPASMVMKSVEWSKSVYKIDSETGLPFSFEFSDLTDVDGNPVVWTKATEGGWNYLDPTKKVVLKGFRNKVLCTFNDAREHGPCYTGNDVRHESHYEGELLWIRWAEELTVVKGVKQLVVEYKIEWKENRGKMRGINKSQFVVTNNALLFNILNPSLSRINIDMVHLQDGIKHDVVYSWLMIAANTWMGNKGSDHHVYKQLDAEIRRINKLLGKANDDLLFIEPTMVVAGLYDHLLYIFQKYFVHDKGIWLDWQRCDAKARMMYELYSNKVAAGEWIEMDAADLEGTAQMSADLKEGERLVVYRERSYKKILDVNADNLALTAKMTGATVEAKALDEKTNILAFILKGDKAISVKQRCALLCGLEDLPLYNVELFESSTVKESISTSQQLMPYIKSLGLVIKDEEVSKEIQRMMITAGKDAMMRLKVMAAMNEGKELAQGYLYDVKATNGNMKLAAGWVAELQAMLLECGAIAHVDDLADERSEGMFSAICNALTDVTFCFSLTNNIVGDLNDEYGDDCEIYMDDAEPDSDVKSNNTFTVWMPALLEFTKLTTNNESNRNWVNLLYFDVILPLLRGEVAKFRSLNMIHGVFRSFLESKESIKLMNGRANLSAKRIGTPDTFLGEVDILWSECDHSVCQFLIRLGVDVAAAKAGEDVYVSVNRAPIAAGYIAKIRVRIEQFVELEDGSVVMQQKKCGLLSDTAEIKEIIAEPCFYWVSDVQFSCDLLSVYMDGGDFDGDLGTLTPLGEASTKFAGKIHATTWEQVTNCRRTSLGMDMFDAKCGEYAADHYGIKPFAGAADQTLWSGLENSIFLNAVKNISDTLVDGKLVEGYITYNQNAYLTQNNAVGTAYAVYMMGEILGDLAMSLKAAGVKLSHAMNLLTGPDARTLVLIVAEIYEVMLGGYSKGANRYRLDLLQNVFDGKPFANTTKNVELVAGVMGALGANTARAAEVGAVLSLVSQAFHATKLGKEDVLEVADLTAATLGDEIRWVLVALTIFEMGRGKFAGFNGVIRKRAATKKGFGHRLAVHHAFKAVEWLKAEGYGALVHDCISLFALNMVYETLGDEISCGPTVYAKANSWRAEHYRFFTDKEVNYTVYPTEVKSDKKDDTQGGGGGSVVKPVKPAGGNDGGETSDKAPAKEAAAPSAKAIVFNSSTAEYAWLSNIHEFSQPTGYGVEFKNLEAAYQLAKVSEPTPAQIKAFAGYEGKVAKVKGKSLAMRPDWDEVKLNVMYDLLLDKFTQPAMRDLLLATGDAELIHLAPWEKNINFYWGVNNDLKGQNNMGKLVMQVREALKAEPAAQEVANTEQTKLVMSVDKGQHYVIGEDPELAQLIDFNVVFSTNDLNKVNADKQLVSQTESVNGKFLRNMEHDKALAFCRHELEGFEESYEKVLEEIDELKADNLPIVFKFDTHTWTTISYLLGEDSGFNKYSDFCYYWLPEDYSPNDELTIISGGQYGADLGALIGAQAVGIKTGGTAPKGWKTEKGSNPDLANFGLTCDNSTNYVPRTISNVNNADATICILWGNSVGTAKTIGYAQSGVWQYPTSQNPAKMHRPCLVIRTKDVTEATALVKAFITEVEPTVINFAGHRESSQPGIQEWTKALVINVFSQNVDDTDTNHEPVTKGEVKLVKRITRQMLKDNPEALFVFGDNFERRGLGGQAKEMRGETNARGIATKHKPSNDADAFFSDADFALAKAEFENKLGELKEALDAGKDIYFPEDGIGTGLSALADHSPCIWNYLTLCLRANLGITKFLPVSEKTVEAEQPKTVPQPKLKVKAEVAKPVLKKAAQPAEDAIKAVQLLEQVKALMPELEGLEQLIAAAQSKTNKVDSKTIKDEEAEPEVPTASVEPEINTEEVYTGDLDADEEDCYQGDLDAVEEDFCFSEYGDISFDEELLDFEPDTVTIQEEPIVPTAIRKAAIVEADVKKSAPLCLKPDEYDKVAELISSLNDEQSSVVDNVLDHQNVFLTGKGGAGKSYTTQVIRKVLDRLNRPYILVGSTGTSVVNIDGHATFNGMFGLNLGFKNRKDARNLQDWQDLVKTCRNNRKIQSKLKAIANQNRDYPVLIIVDEISMIDSMLLSAVEAALEAMRLDHHWLLVGDPCQFEPVDGFHFFDNVRLYDVAIKDSQILSSVFTKLEFTKTNLQNNVRAAGDIEYADAMDKVRMGYPLPRVVKDRWEHSINNPAPEDALQLMFNNITVKRYNDAKTAAMLRAGIPSRVYKASIETHYQVAGKPDDYWVYNSSRTATIFDPIPVELTLCVGMKVMLREVNYTSDGVTNGSIGVVRELKANSVVVDFPKAKGYVIRKVDLDPVKQGRAAVGSFSQIPLVPAYAITIHKAQGMTFDCPVNIHLYSEFQNGDYGCLSSKVAKNAVYVALSRLTTSKNLYFQVDFGGRTPEQAWSIAQQSYHTSKEALAFLQDIDS